MRKNREAAAAKNGGAAPAASPAAVASPAAKPATAPAATPSPKTVAPVTAAAAVRPMAASNSSVGSNSNMSTDERSELLKYLFFLLLAVVVTDLSQACFYRAKIGRHNETLEHFLITIFADQPYLTGCIDGLGRFFG